MDIEPFRLERWFDRHEHGNLMLAESGIRSLPASRFDLDAGPLGYVIPTDGDPALRATVGERYDRTAEELVFTCGAQEANLLAFLALVDGGDHAVVVTPTYQSLSSLPASFGSVTTVALQPPDWTLSIDAVADAIRPETVAVVLANPNNPTGRYHDRETVDALADLTADADAILLCDEVYRLLATDPLDPVAATVPHGVSTSSLTKAFGLAGLRFGWLAGPPAVVRAARRWKDYTTISPPVLSQHIARQALADERQILESNRALARRNRERMRAFVERWELDWYEPVGVTAFVTLPAGFTDSRAFCETLVAETGVVLAPGTCFGYPEYVRIGFGSEPAHLAEGLGRIDAFLADRG